MPPYENPSMHDMHGLLQQLDTLNAAHAPEHLEMWKPSIPTYKDVKDAANAGAKKVSDTYAATKDIVNKKLEEKSSKKLATDQEMINYHFSKDVPRQAEYLKLVIGSANFPCTDLFNMMSQSSVMKTDMLAVWYPEGITDEKRTEVYKFLHPK